MSAWHVQFVAIASLCRPATRRRGRTLAAILGRASWERARLLRKDIQTLQQELDKVMETLESELSAND